MYTLLTDNLPLTQLRHLYQSLSSLDNYIQGLVHDYGITNPYKMSPYALSQGEV